MAFRLALLCSLASLSAFSQPLISPRAIVNAASFMSPGLPAGSIARGSMFSIFGARLGPNSSPSLAFPLVTTLGGVSVKVIAPNGGPSVDAIPVFVSGGQINAIMPSNAPLGTVSVQVTNANGRGNLAPVRVVNSGFGAFAIAAGVGPGIFQNFVSSTDTPLNAPKTPATPGQAVILWGTGLGPATFPDNVAPTAGNVQTRTELFVGGKPATLLYNGRAPCCAGIDQVVFTVPPDAPAGCWVPVTVRTEGATPSNTVTLAISPDGSPCSEPSNPLAAPLLNGGKFGSILLLRVNTREDVNVRAAGDVTTDNAIMNFRREQATAFPFNPIFSLPPAGSCTTYGVIGNVFDYPGPALPLTGTTGAYLDPAALFSQLIGATGARQVMKPAPPFGGALSFYQFGKTLPGSPLKNSAFLQPGDYRLVATGGADVGPFQANFTNPQPLTWTNQPTSIDRTQALPINWSGGPANLPVAIIGGAVDLPTNSSSLFVCMAPAGSNSFQVPAYILAGLPATRPRLADSRGLLYVGAMPLAAPNTFTATGIDLGIASATTLSAKTVTFR